MSRLPFRLPDAQTERELFSLVVRERFARDTADWELLGDSYWPDSVVRVTWFTGTAAEFVEVSRERGRTGSGMHTLAPVRAEVTGDRAVVESRGQILIRPRLEGVECDVVSWCRFVSRAERREDTWRLTSFDGIYVKDRLDVVVPGDAVHLDRALLDAARPPYRFLTYLNRTMGHPVPDDLPGVDRPDLIDAFWADAHAWLAGSR